jgi:hypothetical protein
MTHHYFTVVHYLAQSVHTDPSGASEHTEKVAHHYFGLGFFPWCIGIIPNGMCKGSVLSSTSHIFYRDLVGNFFQILICQLHLQGVNIGI